MWKGEREAASKSDSQPIYDASSGNITEWLAPACADRNAMPSSHFTVYTVSEPEGRSSATASPDQSGRAIAELLHSELTSQYALSQYPEAMRLCF